MSKGSKGKPDIVTFLSNQQFATSWARPFLSLQDGKVMKTLLFVKDLSPVLSRCMTALWSITAEKS